MRVAHLRVKKDPVTNELIYERTLREGQGSTLYGLEVAEALGMGGQPLEQARAIREELLGYE